MNREQLARFASTDTALLAIGREQISIAVAVTSANALRSGRQKEFMDLEGLSDILDRVRAGDTDAYGEIVRHYQRTVHAVVAATLFDPRQADEFVQETFINAFHHLDSFDRSRSFALWLKAIARNVVREHGRKEGRRGRHLQMYREHLLTESTARDELPESQDAMLDLVRRCREQLPEKWNRLVHLRYDLGQGYEDIAAALNKSVEATRQLLFRVRILLRDCVDQKGTGTDEPN